MKIAEYEKFSPGMNERKQAKNCKNGNGSESNEK